MYRRLRTHFKKCPFFDISGELSMSDLAQYDYCSPRYQCVVIPRYTDPNVIYYPPCTRVLRCGGCAPSEVLTCAPKQTSVKHVVVREIFFYKMQSLKLKFC